MTSVTTLLSDPLTAVVSAVGAALALAVAVARTMKPEPKPIPVRVNARRRQVHRQGLTCPCRCETRRHLVRDYFVMCNRQGGSR